MSESLKATIQGICKDCGNDRGRMMDIVRAVQAAEGCVSEEAIDLIAKTVDCHRVEVAAVVSFYAFLSTRPKGKVVIRLCEDPIDQMKGAEHVAEALVDELGIGFGQTTEDGTITLEKTPCIGMCDQAPAALINDEVITYLGADHARAIAQKLKADPDPKKLVGRLGDGNNAHELVRSMVHKQHPQLRRGHLRRVRPGRGPQERPGDEPGRGHPRPEDLGVFAGAAGPASRPA